MTKPKKKAAGGTATAKQTAGKFAPPIERVVADKSVIVREAVSGNGHAGNGQELEGIKTKLHDANSSLQGIYAARNRVKDAEDRILELAADTKEAKDELKNAEAHLKGVIDSHISGQRAIPFRDEEPKTEPKAERNGAKAPVQEAIPAAAPPAPPAKEPAKPWRDEADIDVLKLAPGRVEKLRGADINRIFELEAAIQSGTILKIKGLGQGAVDKISDAYTAYRDQNPIPDPADAVTEDDVAALQQKLHADLEAAREGEEFAEADPDDDLSALEVEDLTDVDESVADTDDVEILEDDDLDDDAADDPDSVQLDRGEESQETPEAAEKPGKGKKSAQAGKTLIDADELIDRMANVFVFVPGEVVDGWNAKQRQQAAACVDQIADAVDGNDDPPAGFPAHLERFVAKKAHADIVAYVKEKRGA